MDWQKVEGQLDKAFRAKPERIGESLVVHRRRPLALAPVMESAMTEDERDEHGDLASWPASVQQLLDEIVAQDELLRFYWESFGPMSWVAGMILVGTGRRRYVGVWDEVESYRLFAAVEPWDDALALSSAVSAYLVVNGRRHGDGLFGSLPQEVSNDCPELLPTPVVKQALFDYMQWAESVDPGSWALLASEHYGRMVEPDHLTRSLDVLRTMPSLDRVGDWLEELERESDELSCEARQRLFDEWFETAYAVRGGVGRR
ncbi:MAG: hypothetical protein R6W48_07885 [Gaiellaceae bacterium]